jgi:large conductance mechanosensitive channel
MASNLLKEFKAFAMRGNVIDLAIGVIIGASFGKIVSSLVSDVIMPPIGMIVGQLDFKDLFVVLDGKEYASLAAARAAGAPVIAYGAFLTVIIDFLIVAFVIFLMVRQINKLLAPKDPAPLTPTTKPCPFCRSVIALEATRCAHCTSDLKGIAPA